MPEQPKRLRQPRWSYRRTVWTCLLVFILFGIGVAIFAHHLEPLLAGLLWLVFGGILDYASGPHDKIGEP